MDLKELRQLIRMLEGTQISEVEIRKDDSTVRITRAICPPPAVASPVAMGPYMQSFMMPQQQMPQSMVATTPEAWEKSPRPEVVDTLVAITSPMIGTFYRAISPEAEPIIHVGDIVEKGQVLCLIEAMKLMNEIESDMSGRIVRILKENATPVEFGEELFLIEPI